MVNFTGLRIQVLAAKVSDFFLLHPYLTLSCRNDTVVFQHSEIQWNGSHILQYCRDYSNALVSFSNPVNFFQIFPVFSSARDQILS